MAEAGTSAPNATAGDRQDVAHAGESPAEESLRPAEVAETLGVSTATLRRWSRRFENFLSVGADRELGRSHRRYTTTDLDLLAQVRALLEEGWTYDQVAEHLQKTVLNAEEVEAQAEPEAGDNLALTTTESPTTGQQLPPVVQLLQESLQSLGDSQQITLNSQQAARDLMGVMIQDNLNLKNENTDLRDRMLVLERDLAEMRRRHADYRERMETRVRVLEDAVATLMARRQAPPPQKQPPQRPANERRTFWSRLIGG